MTPSAAADFFASRLANFASVLVPPTPREHGRPVHCLTVRFRLRHHSVKSPTIPDTSTKHSSIEYCSTAGALSARAVIKRIDMSQYKEKFVDKTTTSFSSHRREILKYGSPIFTPSALTSLLRAIAQPSLELRTRTGDFSRSGLNTRSHDTNMLLTSTNANAGLIAYNAR